jgi:hypothetical protein
VRNNVIYNYGGTASGLTQGKFEANYVANYIRPGPSSRARTPITVGDQSDLRFYIRDNIFEGNEAITADNTRFFQPDEFRSQVHTVDAPFAAPPVTQVPAKDALELVLASVGASRPVRDAADARLVQHVRTRTGAIIDSQKQVGGWPTLRSGVAPLDTDGDGLPDEWEKRHGLDPRNPADAQKSASPGGYTNLENYLNELAAAARRSQ